MAYNDPLMSQDFSEVDDKAFDDDQIGNDNKETSNLFDNEVKKSVNLDD